MILQGIVYSLIQIIYAHSNRRSPVNLKRSTEHPLLLTREIYSNAYHLFL